QHRSTTGDVGGDLQQQRRFADPRISAEEGHRPRNETPAEDPIELLLAGAEALQPTGSGQGPGGGPGGRGCGWPGPRGRTAPGLECVPFPTKRALTLTFEGLTAAGATGKNGI